MKRFAAFILLFSMVLFSCSPDDQLNTPDRTALELNYNQLNQRVDLKAEAVPLQRVSAAAPPNLTLIAEVSPPSLGGDQLHAAAVDIKGNYAYVTYHKKFEPYGGIVDVIDLSTPSNPTIVAQLQITDTDFYTVDASNSNYLIIAGARSVDQSGYDSPTNHKGAVVQKINLSNGLITQASLPLTETPLNSFAATSTDVYDGYVIASTGDQNGGIYALDENSFQASVNPDFFKDDFYAEFVNLSENGRVVYLQGSQSNAAIMHYGDFNGSNGFHNMSSTNIPFNTTFVGKNGVEIFGNTAYVALGDDGLLSFDIQTGTYQGPVNYNVLGKPASATADTEYLYVANGLDGMQVLDRTDANLPLLGTWNFADEANVIKTDGTYIFIAHGLGGLKILKIGSVDLIDCGNANFPDYTGNSSQNLNVSTPTQFQKGSGGGEVKNLNVNADGLEWCDDLKVKRNASVSGYFYFSGSKLEIERSLWVNSGGDLQVQGESKIKRNSTLNDKAYFNGETEFEGNLIVNSGAHLKIKGDLIIKGKLILEGTIEFIGNNNTLTVENKISLGANAQVIGNYSGPQL